MGNTIQRYSRIWIIRSLLIGGEKNEVYSSRNIRSAG